MKIWKKASAVFIGGTENIKSLNGIRVKVTTDIRSNIYDHIGGTDLTADLTTDTIGFISRPNPNSLDELLIAFPKSKDKTFRNLGSLTQSGDFFVIRINSPTFKANFDIEC